jgi:hypothetical protein
MKMRMIQIVSLSVRGVSVSSAGLQAAAKEVKIGVLMP